MKTHRILALVIAAVLPLPFAARGVTDTWDGGGINDLLTLDDNWLDNSAPLSDLVQTDLIFAGSVRLTPAVLAAFSARSITFNNTAGAFVIEGQPFDVGSGGIVNSDTQTMTFDNRVRFSGVADATINAVAGGLSFGNTVTGPSGTLTVAGGNPTRFTNFFTATRLNKLGAGTMTWSPTANAGIDLTIGGGTVTMGADGSPDLFTSSSSVAVNGTSTFNINESLTLDGAQVTRASGATLSVAAGKTFTMQNGGDAVITDTFTNNTASTIVVTGAGSTFSTTSFVTFNGGSTLNVTNGADVTSGGLVSIGLAGSATVTVDGTGSTLAGTSLVLGANSGTGNLTFTNNSGGTFTTIGLVTSAVGGASGTLNIESGSDITGTSLSVASATGVNTGTVTVTGAGSTLTLSGANPAGIGSASLSSGRLNVNSSGTFNSGTGLTTVRPTGTVSIAGGVYNSNGNLTIDGGRLTRNSAGILALDPGTTLTVQDGGDVVIDGEFSNSTASTIAVTGAGSTFSTAGILGIQNGSTLNVTAGGRVDSGGGTAAIGTIGGSGTVSVDGVGSTLTAGSLFSGQSGLMGSVTFSNGSTGQFALIAVDVSLIAGTNGLLAIQSGASVTGSELRVASASAANSGIVTIAGSESALTLTGAAPATIGALSASSGTLNVNTGGTFNSGTGLTTVNPTGTISIAGGIYNSNGDLTINGGQLTRDAAGAFTMGSGRTLTVQNGGDAFFTVAYVTTTPSTINVTGAGSTFSTAASLNFGHGSIMNISAGGSAALGGAGTANIGVSGGNGTVTVDGNGSSLTASSAALGSNGFDGALTFRNGSSGSFLGMSVGSSINADSVGTLDIQSGAKVDSGSLNIANQLAASRGIVTITGTNSALTLTGAATIGAASASTGTVNVQSGGTFSTGVGTSSINATGTLNLDSGTLNLGGPLAVSGTMAITGTGAIEGTGSILKNGASTLTLPNSNSYAGGTSLRGGTIIAAAASGALGSGNVIVESGAVKLTIQTGVLSAIADSATLSLAGGGVPNVADNGFAELAAGVNEILTGLVLGTAAQPPGTYGSTLSSATFRSNEFFSGPGILTVIPEPHAATALLAGFSALLGLQRFRPRGSELRFDRF
jgi:fibronectin-binding autotransporter adhesin